MSGQESFYFLEAGSFGTAYCYLMYVQSTRSQCRCRRLSEPNVSFQCGSQRTSFLRDRSHVGSMATKT